MVVGSDYTSSVVSLLAADGTVLSDAWIDSGTTAPGLVSTLSGDVAVGSGAAAGTVILIDRQSTDVVSAWCLDGSLVGQLRVRSADSSFSPNPHDAVVVGDTGWVTRNDTNPSGAAEPGDRGGDIFGFDATTMVANGRRVDFSSFEGMTDAGVAYSARPGRLLTNGARLFTVLGRTPTDYSDTDAAASVFVSVDATSSAVESLELTGLRNCDLVDAIPGDGARFIVTCLGWSSMFFGGPDTYQSAGIVEVAIDGDGVPSLARSWRPGAEDALAVQNVVVLDDHRVVASAFGDFGGPVFDRLFVVDFDSGMSSLLLESTESYTLGQGALVGDTLLVPDASEDVRAVRRFSVGETLTEVEPIEVGPAALPPRVITGL
ncbi:MAG: hypothetical protein H6720_30710 [Sandaracinus sp.]|nr:hypothetical protein [Sandaracinus sp.]